ncbi:protein-export chaperone SecB [Desulfovibrio desulfuricans]|uniref:protein-export chaperone SecB n=1 Tax=Desulfovibrio desulfuricans TaxID=876 RepID=UPI001C018495|nr:protein-export chaperone SecB [Desulfovibrio desulfuricans]MBT9748627.1 hypothetical protein [Desulfovibrio desulfuricans]
MFQSSPLKLEGYGISSFGFSTDQGYNPEKGINGDNIKLSVEKKYKKNTEDSSLHLIEMKISVKPKESGGFPYTINMEIGGVFRTEVTEHCPEDKLAGIVAVNAPSLLYGVAREYIFIATCHNMCGPFMLPSISFIPQKTQTLAQKRTKSCPLQKSRTEHN